jgi:VWFA-related protein
MLANRARLAYAVGRFADTGRPDDEVFALVVGDHVTPVLPPEQPFTSDPDVLRRAVFGALGSLGRTAIWDGVLEGLTYLERGAHTRRALVVISDGQDNASQASFEEVLSRVRSSSAAVYTMGLIDPIEVTRRPRSLRTIAQSSGGEAYFPQTHQAAMVALETIARQIHSAYTLGFTPAARDRDGRYHKLAVRVRGTAGQSFDAQSRAGYLASHDSPAER